VRPAAILREKAVWISFAPGERTVSFTIGDVYEDIEGSNQQPMSGG
jgi:hypothetical protein